MTAACWVTNLVVWMEDSLAERTVAPTAVDSGANWALSTVAKTVDHLVAYLVEMMAVRLAYQSVEKMVGLKVE